MLSNTQKKKKRQETILLSLDKLGFATRSQLQVLHSLGTDRNAIRVLKEMGEYVHIKRVTENIYYLNQLGREVIGSEREVKWNNQIDHHLLRNDMYIYFGSPQDWKSEQPVTFKHPVKDGIKTLYKDMTIVPDATFSKDGVFYFLEVDRTQSMSENKKKIQQYKLLSPAIEQQFQSKPILVFYTTTIHRKEILTKECQEVVLNHLILTKEDL